MTEVQIQTQLLTAGVLTVDEVRAMRGLGPIELAAPAILPTLPADNQLQEEENEAPS